MTLHTPRDQDRPMVRDWILAPAMLALLIFGIPMIADSLGTLS